ncbi:MAG TPA: hypothetical protein VG389_00865 [Myxococcota bacterium]|jgi:hypothetical protein|nr:hypothetical protein [Myxococcota bacterium]
MTASAARLFDIHLESDLRPDDDLRNLAWFGVTDALVCLHDPGPAPASPSSAGPAGGSGSGGGGGSGAGSGVAVHPAAERLLRLVEREPPRLRAAGIRAWLAPGVPPGFAETPGVAAALDLLPELLRREGVVAVGGIGPGTGSPREERALALQLRLAAAHDLPALVCLPRHDRPAALRRALAVAAAAGLPPERLCFSHANLPALREARRRGTHAALGIHPADFEPEAAARLVARHGADRLCLGSMLGVGPGDVLALPRIGRALARAAVPADAAARALFANAVTFLGLDERAA